MSLSEIKAFSKTATKSKVRRQIQTIIATTLGAQGDKNGIKKAIGELEQSLADIERDED